MNLCVIGTGYVGLVTGACFAHKGHRVICVDKDTEKIRLLNTGGIPIYEPGLEAIVKACRKAGRLRFVTEIPKGMKDAEVIFICVDTPPTPAGTADLSAVENVTRQIARHLTHYTVIVHKSTMPVKTGEKVLRTLRRYAGKGSPCDVVSNPEFLREGSAMADAMAPDRVVLGVTSSRAARIMKKLYADVKAPVLVTDIGSAELIKHASNSFLAMKISFINAVAVICELSGADVQLVAKGMGLDPRIGERFLNAGIGYGGSCFPKDVSAFEQIARELGYDFGLLREVQNINREMRDRFLKKVEEEVWVVKGKTFGIWGLAFKPDTDDIRESPAVEIVQRLQEKGAIVQAFDPKAEKKAEKVLQNVRYCPTPEAAAKDADALLICTEWPAFKAFPLPRLKKLLRHPVVIDGRNVFDPATMRAAGFDYRSVGRP
jgi:UDPglucose 6-dehydrogenase